MNEYILREIVTAIIDQQRNGQVNPNTMAKLESWYLLQINGGRQPEHERSKKMQKL